jgi:hypothetical protein
MPRLADVIAPLHGLASLVGALWLALYYPRELSLLLAILLMLWPVSGVVLSHRYLELERAAEHRGFQWMRDRLLEASRERRGQNISDDEP